LTASRGGDNESGATRGRRGGWSVLREEKAVR